MVAGGELIPRPLIEVDPEGFIVKVEQYRDVDRLHHTEFYSGILCAGFINAHCHLELSYLRGRISPHKGFAHFAQMIGRVRGEATPEERLRAIERADRELRREGVVGVGDIVNGESSMLCKARSPIAYHSFGEVFGLRTDSTEHMSWVDSYADCSLTPHSIYSLNDPILKDIATQKSDAPLSIHFKESASEEELFCGEGSLWDWYQSAGFECDFLHYGSAAQRIVSVIPPHRSVILVHNCCVTQRDIEIIQDHFTAPVYWALCPASNDFISQITPPAELLRKSGVNICIGTDSLASNHSLSMVAELKHLPSIPLAERIDWATRQGARALGMDLLGDIAVGKQAGINVLSGIDYKTLQLTDNTQLQVIVHRDGRRDRQPE